jgi:hypothetical protein
VINKAELLNRFPSLVRVIAARKRYFQYRKYNGMPIRDVFDDIYAKKFWMSDESASGRGSELGNTEIVRKQLPQIVDAIGARSLLDIPCGDFNWMKSVDLSKIESYIGADIVAALIRSNQELYGGQGTDFRVLDLTSNSLPKVDLILCRDLFVHLSDADVWKSLKAIRESGSEHILLTTYRNFRANYDIITGSFRRMNMELQPFNFRSAILYIEEYDLLETNKSLGLWKVSDLSVD